ncbi:BEL1-like homeodomain protein 1 [Primulina huaijiensis]|uniref:BEL1-like homeodomain protein 1 n=1 Tax=Primulina huaijiensis TaxID=1492673 RepID=UPI003CC72F1C
MATYFHGNSEILGSGDGLQTLIFMNPAYVGFSDNQPPAAEKSSNFVFLNPNSSGNSLPFSNAPPSHTQHFVGIPLQSSDSTAVAAMSTQQQSQQPNVSALHGFLPGVHYNLYNQHIDLQEAREVSRSHQGLSLSLSSHQQQQPPAMVYGSFEQEREVPTQAVVTTVSTLRGGDFKGTSGGSPSSTSGVLAGVNGAQSVLWSSKYLKVVQELLDEVANVGKGEKSRNESDKGINGQLETNGKSKAAAADAANEDRQSGGESSAKRGSELSTAERQEIQMKKGKLVNMLDEVEQRYRQYHHQMQIVISWFEHAAGIGSAKVYTAVALQTISKQFRCLKDSILGQIKSASKSLGEEDRFGDKVEGSRLKYVDNQIRQQRALQQLGMIQENAWRPQRGLPERSVSVLRAWLFEHFLHPYPKDSDKIMLAKQTGLTRSQVSNWFINARVRLWKPMVEEMYLEEVKENEKNGSEDKHRKREQIDESISKSPETSPGTKKPNKSIISSQETHQPLNHKTASTMAIPTNSTSQSGANIRNQPVFNLVASSERERITQPSPKKQRNPEIIDFASKTTDTGLMSLKFGTERQTRDGFTFMGAPTNLIGGFGSYPMGELERFGSESFQAPYSGNGVSLTLGLPHCESLPISGSHSTYLPNQSIQIGRGVEIGEANFITSEY